MSDESDISMFDAESDFSDDDFFEESVAPPPKKAAAPKRKTPAATATSKATSKGGKKTDTATAEDSNEDFEALAPSTNAASKKGSKKTVEEIYQKKTQLEHILLRPDTYIGSTEPRTEPMYVLNSVGRIEEREITYTPGLFKIFDEILVNAADNKQRDPNMNKIEIEIDAENNTISVCNNGKGIPVVMHKEHKVYVPTLIFSHLLTGSNFDDNEKKTTGGRNGFGSKLTSIFSKLFIVECLDSEKGLKFKQVIRENMSVKEEPIVKKCTAAEAKKGDYVKITFSPDLERFKMRELDADTVVLFSKRAYDIAGSMARSPGKKLVVYLNGDKLPIKNFEDYIGLFEGVNAPVAYEKSDRWEVGVSASEDSSLKQISFVNAICTSKGGGHVNYVVDQIVKHLEGVVKKKNKGAVKPSIIKNHLNVFVNCLIENPTFDSQTKENLTSRPKSFGSKCQLSPTFLKKVEKSNIVDMIVNFASFKDRQALKKKSGKKTQKLLGITKLDDANFAGTAKSKDCTLIITEGDSAKSLAMAGLSVVGRDYYGVFPLRGKPMNVREESVKKILANEEIKNLVEILGLKFQEKYDETSIKSLRYGHLMIMADQDVDGSHIKGLIINLFHHFWPSLLNVPGFLQQFITPIIKVTKGGRSKAFFSLPEFKQWFDKTDNGKGYSIKYYKGLGTSTSAEAKEYFSKLDLHEVHFDRIEEDVVDVEADLEVADAMPASQVTGDDLIDMVFSKGRVEDRKVWLNNIDKDAYLDYSNVPDDGILYSDFINREYIHFSKYDNERSIPHFMDGFKPSQRKVLFGCFKRKLTKNEVKVAQLTGYVAEHSAYHHGETSLQATIVGMAQNFVASNNINLLTPSGQFGTRRMGGADAASARYIFTKLEPIARTIFHPDDDELLKYNEDDGMKIEPEYYVPVIPMVLVNGSEGIGTGWSSKVPNYNPRDIIENLRRMIDGEESSPMVPFYGGFTGSITPKPKNDGSYNIRGKIERIDDTTVVISELPLKKWTQDYKQFLDGMISGDAKKKIEPELKDFKENHTETTVSFTITAEKEKIDQFEKERDGLYGKFKLIGSLSTSNMTLFNADNKIQKFEKPEDIMSAFFAVRLQYYDLRKESLVAKLEKEQKMLTNKARFVEEVCSGSLVVSNRKRDELLVDLHERGYETFSKTAEKSDNDDSDDDESVGDDGTDLGKLTKGYEYLLGMKIWSLTFEKAEELRQQVEAKTAELEDLLATEPSTLWLRDLEAVEDALDERDAEADEAATKERVAQKKSQKRQAKAAKKKSKAGKKKKKDEWDSDDEDSENEEMDLESEDDSVKVVKKKSVSRKVAPALKKAATKNASVATKPAAPNPKAAAKPVLPKPKAAAKPLPVKRTAEAVDSDSESDDDIPLFQRLAVSPEAKKRMQRPVELHSSPFLARNKSLADDDSVDSLGAIDVENYDPASVTPACHKKPRPKKLAATKTFGKKAAAKKTSILEESFEAEMSSDEEKNVVQKVVRPTRTGRAAASRVNYASSDAEGSDSDFEFE